MLVATRKDTDPHGNKWEEAIFQTGEDSFKLAVRSDDPEDCFDVDMTLQELRDYTRTAVKPFVWAVVEGRD